MNEKYLAACEGTVTPPADMMLAAMKSLSATGFANLMERTGGRTPTPAELVEFADAERLAGVSPPYERPIDGTIAASNEDAGAAMIGASRN